MTFSVNKDQERTAKNIIDNYFDALQKYGPGGMRSQCYSDDDNENNFVHIKSFTKESVARQHFRSPIFSDYINNLSAICDNKPVFSKLFQEKTFESIY